MDDLIQTLASNDIVKFKRVFAEAMKEKVALVLAEEKLKIARSVMIEGEIVEAEDDVEDEDDDSDEDDDDSEEDEDE